MRQFGNLAIIIFGPPGSGKGTQAQLLADKLDYVHFDTGRYIRELLYNPKFNKNKTIKKERQLNKSGKLNTTPWVLKIVDKKIDEINRLKKGIILSGSPRTILEAFGNNKNRGIMKVLEKDYGKKNIFIFVLNIPEKESIKRNSHRLICSVCRSPILGIFDDKKEIVVQRMKEYRRQTYPIIKELKKRKFKIININAAAMPYKIYSQISKKILNK
ncbi:MAG: Adenylate kinase [Candidatus Wolfebacteria bacterium GW2011_GWC1_37_10]|uniref:Adenylate kinase n=1 Tax=Candidatus Wolfebacteria bacterium GW2011_GWC1_37_10 TaxID=1619010 RepID=A0A0G0J522_9BACT|nr:MAG: Adenylate kinase [Candidatus Wolfebacteria bacterium GW2011_GWC1_37_10]